MNWGRITNHSHSVNHCLLCFTSQWWSWIV